jgi:polysaccharide chain length determinant protein (PEP-CTERM system associated)
MVRSGDITLSDVKRLARRYWWLVTISVIVCGSAGMALSILLPKRYNSETMILVKQPTVPVDVVKPIISGDLTRRLASMQEQILSRTRLQPVIDKLDLYPKDRAKLSDDDLVKRLRAAVKITPLEPMQGTDARQLPGFYVDVEFENPKLAQAICAEITSMFLEQNTIERQTQANQTTSFLTQQLNEAKTKLDEQDAKLAQFKRQYLGSLPEEEQANLSLLASLNTELQADTQSLSRAEQDKAFNESLLSQQEANVKISSNGQIVTNKNGADLDALENQLAVLMAHYTSKHPDVVKLENQIEELKKAESKEKTEQANTKDESTARTSVSPQGQQLRAKIKQDEISIADLTKAQAQVQQQIRSLQARVQSSPVVEQQIKELTRSYQTALDFYNDLLKRRENSQLAANLEGQQGSEQFSVFDPPSLPDKPSFPNESMLRGGGFAAGFAIGLGLLYLIAYNDRSMHTEIDVEKCLKLPVLTMVPELEAKQEAARGATRFRKSA